ncbi:MAG TPA: glycosyltransferase [Novosphingobium sp.]|nr:glycosyltransferase [Novosphingobium sp.]
MTDLVDLIVPVYKNIEITRQCLETLVRHLDEIAECKPRVIAINDSPGDPVGDLLQDMHRAGHIDVLIENAQNQGFVHSVNKGLAMARKRGAAAILVNSDTITFAGTLREMLDVARIDPMIGFINPRTNNASIATFPQVDTQGCSVDECFAKWASVKDYLPRFSFAPTAVGYYMYIRPEVVQAFGYLDTKFGVGYEEENDLVMRANKVGYRAVFANHAYAYHAGSASFLLTDIDLHQHKNANLALMTQQHPEFLPLVRQYEASAHYRAERLLAHLVPDAGGRVVLGLNLMTMGRHFNGTNEIVVRLLQAIEAINDPRFDVVLVMGEAEAAFFGFDTLSNVRISECFPKNCALAVHPCQPFDLDYINILDMAAPINIYIMHDAIALDCGYIGHNQNLQRLWGVVMSWANGAYFISDVAERSFANRFRISPNLLGYTQMYPVEPACYGARAAQDEVGDHVYVAGNHFLHKDAGRTATVLLEAFPDFDVWVMDRPGVPHPRIRYLTAGEVDEDEMAAALSRSQAIVLPSYYEGFGLTLMHALALGKPVVARDIAATREILARFDDVSGVYLFRNDEEMAEAVRAARKIGSSRVVVRNGGDWRSWAAGLLDFFASTMNPQHAYTQLTGRLEHLDFVRSRQIVENMPQWQGDDSRLPAWDEDYAHLRMRNDMHYDEVVNVTDEEFLYFIYNLLLKRNPDPSGFRAHLGALRGGAPRVKILRSFLRSQEYGDRGYKVVVRGMVKPTLVEHILQ